MKGESKKKPLSLTLKSPLSATDPTTPMHSGEISIFFFRSFQKCRVASRAMLMLQKKPNSKKDVKKSIFEPTNFWANICHIRQNFGLWQSQTGIPDAGSSRFLQKAEDDAFRFGYILYLLSFFVFFLSLAFVCLYLPLSSFLLSTLSPSSSPLAQWPLSRSAKF